MDIEIKKISTTEFRKRGINNWPIWEKVIGLLASGALDVNPIIGGVWPITEWHEAFEKMHTGQVVKSILRPV